MTARYIAHDKSRNRFIVHYDGKTIAYSISRYGNFAELLAKKTLETGKRYNDYFEDQGDGTTIFYVNTKAYGVKEVLVDTEDTNLLCDLKMSISKDNHAYTSYAKTKNGSVHRIIMKQIGAHNIIDHINRNGLDNRKCNLRIVNTSVNNRNANIRCDNTTGVKGICEDENRYRVFWYDENMKKHSVSYSKKLYGKKKAFEMAKKFRENIDEKYGYIA